MKTTEQIISEYEDLYLQMQDLQKEAERLKDWAIPQEVKDMLAEIDDEFAPQLQAIQSSLALAEDQLKSAVLERQSTISGNIVQAVYRKGSVKWDAKHLERLANEFPRILEAREEGKPSVAIQVIKTKEQK